MTLLRASGLTRSFDGRTVLQDVSLAFAPGEVVGVLGENGAGKSTLVRLLCGELQPDGGTMELLGRPFAPRSPRAAARAGIGVVHQHFALVPGFDAAENLALAMDLPFLVRRARIEALARDLATHHGLPLEDLRTPVADLPVGVQQRIEILKALARPTRCLLLDEPTAVLAPPEVAAFLAVVRALRARGITCVLVDHRLPEVLAVADRVVVLRHGRVVLDSPARDQTAAQLSRVIVGHEVPAHPPRTVAATPAASVLELRGVHARRGRMRLHDLTLTLRPGEVLGIAGVDGNGQRELCELLLGLLPPESGGSFLVAGQPAAPRGRLPGAAVVPPDRRQALALSLPVAENLSLDQALLPRSRLGLLSHAELRRRQERVVATHALRMPPGDGPVRLLSGGNQQKLVVARALETRARWIVAVNPTRGLDVGAEARVHEELLRFVAEGALVVISSDLDEVLAMSDRVQVLYRGRLSTEFRAPFTEAVRAAVGAAMTGAGA